MMHGTMNVKKKAVHFEKKRKIGLKMKKSQADEDCMFLMSLLLSIKKKKDDIQRLELRMEFLSSVTTRVQVSKNFFAAS